MDKINGIQDKAMHLLYTYGPKILGVIVFFIIVLYIINLITKLLTKALIKRGIDVSLQSFLGSMISVGLKVLLLVSVAGMIGIQTTSFVAVIGALEIGRAHV